MNLPVQNPQMGVILPTAIVPAPPNPLVSGGFVQSRSVLPPNNLPIHQQFLASKNNTQPFFPPYPNQVFPSSSAQFVAGNVSMAGSNPFSNILPAHNLLPHLQQAGHGPAIPCFSKPPPSIPSSVSRVPFSNQEVKQPIQQPQQTLQNPQQQPTTKFIFNPQQQRQKLPERPNGNTHANVPDERPPIHQQQPQNPQQNLQNMERRKSVSVKQEGEGGDQPDQRPIDRPLEIDCWNTALSGWEEASLIKSKIGLLVNGRYKIIQSIASGSYGEIFAAEDTLNRGSKRHRVAVKFDAACRDDHLRYEYKVYKSALYEDGRGKIEGFPQVYWYGHEYGHNIMVMELLGAPIASLFSYCGRKFGKYTIMEIGEQMLLRIKHLHQRGFIHRDIKPENFLMGLEDRENMCYLIDFGLARRYRYRFRENRNLVHIPFRRGRFFVGTAKYASLNSHRNIELSRRDDLESLAYVLIELINGQLPWKNISKNTRLYSGHKIRMMKEQSNWAELCPSMAEFVRYCRDISFTEEPNYDILLAMLRTIVIPVDRGGTAIPKAQLRLRGSSGEGLPHKNATTRQKPSGKRRKLKPQGSCVATAKDDKIPVATKNLVIIDPGATGGLLAIAAPVLLKRGPPILISEKGRIEAGTSLEIVELDSINPILPPNTLKPDEFGVKIGTTAENNSPTPTIATHQPEIPPDMKKDKKASILNIKDGEQPQNIDTKKSKYNVVTTEKDQQQHCQPSTSGTAATIGSNVESIATRMNVLPAQQSFNNSLQYAAPMHRNNIPPPISLGLAGDSSLNNNNGGAGMMAAPGWESDYYERNTTTTSSAMPSPEPSEPPENELLMMGNVGDSDDNNMADDEADEEQEIALVGDMKEQNKPEDIDSGTTDKKRQKKSTAVGVAGSSLLKQVQNSSGTEKKKKNVTTKISGTDDISLHAPSSSSIIPTFKVGDADGSVVANTSTNAPTDSASHFNPNEQQQQKNATAIPNNNNNISNNQRPMFSWQELRESSLDRRAQYENRFSWTLPSWWVRTGTTGTGNMLSANAQQQQHLQGDGGVPPGNVTQAIQQQQCVGVNQQPFGKIPPYLPPPAFPIKIPSTPMLAVPVVNNQQILNENPAQAIVKIPPSSLIQNQAMMPVQAGLKTFIPFNPVPNIQQNVNCTGVQQQQHQNVGMGVIGSQKQQQGHQHQPLQMCQHPANNAHQPIYTILKRPPLQQQHPQQSSTSAIQQQHTIPQPFHPMSTTRKTIPAGQQREETGTGRLQQQQHQQKVPDGGVGGGISDQRFFLPLTRPTTLPISVAGTSSSLSHQQHQIQRLQPVIGQQQQFHPNSVNNTTSGLHLQQMGPPTQVLPHPSQRQSQMPAFPPSVQQQNPVPVSSSMLHYNNTRQTPGGRPMIQAQQSLPQYHHQQPIPSGTLQMQQQQFSLVSPPPNVAVGGKGLVCPLAPIAPPPPVPNGIQLFSTPATPMGGGQVLLTSPPTFCPLGIGMIQQQNPQPSHFSTAFCPPSGGGGGAPSRQLFSYPFWARPFGQ